ncbi:MAG: hypothetical protein RIT04_685 [Candidatus Parcubacteria bacterium]|jgi:hypothetical protein
MTIDIKNLHKSKTFRILIAALIACMLLLVVFQAGIFVGYHKAAFSFKTGEKYYRAFDQQKPRGLGETMMRGFDQDDLPGGHGAVGKVVKVTLPTIIVSGVDAVEKIVEIDPSTIIHKFRDKISPKDILIGDMVVVIGEPNDNTNNVTARFIRILPPPPSLMSASSTK